MASALPFVEGKIKQRQVVLFSKSYSPESKLCKETLASYPQLTHDVYEFVDIEKRSDCSQVEDYLWKLSGKDNREVPLLFVKTYCVGGYWEIQRLHSEDKFEAIIDNLKDQSDEHDDPILISVKIDILDDTEIVIKVEEWADTSHATHVDYDALAPSGSNDSFLLDLNNLVKYSLKDSRSSKPNSSLQSSKATVRPDEEDGEREKDISKMSWLKLNYSSQSSIVEELAKTGNSREQGSQVKVKVSQPDRRASERTTM